MKQITNKTILKQGDKTYQPIEVDGVIYWIDDDLTIKDVRPYYGSYHYEKGVAINKFPDYLTDLSECKLIVAQSQPKLEFVPVITLYWNVEKLAEEYRIVGFETNRNHREATLEKIAFIKGFKSNPNQYTKEDIEKAFDLGYQCKVNNGYKVNGTYQEDYVKCLEQISSISVIEVGDEFNILSYK
jgi:hypothetical protein